MASTRSDASEGHTVAVAAAAAAAAAAAGEEFVVSGSAPTAAAATPAVSASAPASAPVPAPVSVPPGILASTSQPVVGADGEAHDAELERRWASVYSGLCAVRESVEGGGRARKRRKNGVGAEAWGRVYVDVHALYQHRDPAKKRRMYERVRGYLREYVIEQLACLRALVGGDGVVLLREYRRRWDESVAFVKSMKRMLHHLQHFWVPENCNLSKDNPVRPLDRLLMFYWREDLLAKLPEITTVVLGMIDDDRMGACIDHDSVRAVVDTLVVLGCADASSIGRDGSGDTGGGGGGGGGEIPCAPSQPMRCLLTLSADARRKLYDDPIHSAESLHLYLQVFEEEFLKRTAGFYAGEADKMMRGNCVSSFMREVVARLDEEIGRGQRLLHPDSMPRLRASVEEKLVGAHMQYLQSETDAMIRAGREEDLAMVFKLLERLDGGLGPIRDCLKKYIVEQGTEIMASCAVTEHMAEDDDAVAGSSSRKDTAKKRLAVVDDLVQLHTEKTLLIQRCFGGSHIFIKALDDAFSLFMNKPVVGSLPMAEVLAYFVDSSLRNPRSCLLTVDGSSATGGGIADHRTSAPVVSSFLVSRGLMKPAARENNYIVPMPDDASLDEPIMQQMDRIIRLFMYVDDKDMFHETFRKSLAKRLLSKHDDVYEREFISKLKLEMGTVFTSKLSGMFHDVAVSDEERQKFRSYTENGGVEGAVVAWKDNIDASEARRIDFNAHVLNALFWPAFHEDHLRIPRPVVQWQQTFESFYMRNKESKRIKWIHSQSTSVVAVNLNEKSYLFHVSSFQACILLCFNDKTRLSLAELSLALNLQPATLARHIQPLVVSKKNPLFVCHGNASKLPPLPGYADDDKAIEFAERETKALFEVAREGGDGAKKRQTDASAQSGCSGDSREGGVGSATGPNLNVQFHATGVSDGFVSANSAQHAPGPSLLTGAELSTTLNAQNAGHSAPVGGPSGLQPIVGGVIFLNPSTGFTQGHSTPQVVSSASVVGAAASGLSGALSSRGGSAVSLHNSGEAGGGVTAGELTAADGVLEPSTSFALPVSGGGGADNDTIGTADRVDDDDDDEEKVVVESVISPSKLAPAEDVIDSRSGVGCGSANEVRKEVEKAASVSGAGTVGVRNALAKAGDVSSREMASVDSLPPPPLSGGLDAAHDVYYELVPLFRSRTIRVQYPAQMTRVTTKEAVVARQNVVLDRNSLLDAALVRIMKQRKTAGYQQLMAEVLSQVSGTFKPEARAVKDRLEHMIEREFIERSPDDPSVYLYTA